MQPLRQYHPAAAIQALPRNLANQIAAGEVVERPASVIKELVENALDAGASQIDIQINNGGLQSICVTDNGYGIRGEELMLAVSRHATSKITTLTDLENIASMGFRGEALASISSVSRLQIASRFYDSGEAWQLVFNEQTHEPQINPAAQPAGTRVEVAELFYNTPARRRFLRSERTEYRHVEDIFKRLALSRFEVGFSLKHNHKEIYRLPPAADQRRQQQRLQKLTGNSFVSQAAQVDFNNGELRLYGWVGLPDASRTQADLQYVYVNGRLIRDRVINHALRQAYQDQIYPGRYPAYVLYLEVDPARVDVNVHPTKHEVRFREARLVHDFLHHVLNETLRPGDRAVASAQPQAPRAAYYKPATGNIPAAWQVREAAQTNPSGSAPAVVTLPEQTRAFSDKHPAGVRLLGGVRQRYILAEDDAGLILVDARRVRQQQLVDVFKNRLAQQTVKSQPLLFPEALNLQPAALQWLQEQMPLLEKLGFEFTPLGERQRMLRRVPAVAGQLNYAAMMSEFLSRCSRQADTDLSPDEVIADLATSLVAYEAFESYDLQLLLNVALNEHAEPGPSPTWLRLTDAELERLIRSA